MITASDFNVTGDTPSDIQELNAALQYLQQSSAGTAELQNMIAAGVTININHSDIDQYSPSGNVINWDPNAALVVSSASNQAGASPGIDSPALNLIHEGEHSTDPNYDTDVNTSNALYDNDAEEYAVLQTDVIAQQLGEPLRYNHSGDILDEANSTSSVSDNYDSNGNLTSQVTTSYNYDSNGNLTSVTAGTVNYNPDDPTASCTFTQTTQSLTDGSTLNDQSGTETSSGIILTDDVTGTGAVVNASNATISLADDASAVLNGSGGNTINIGSGASLTDNAVGDTVVMTGVGSTVSIDNAAVTLANDASATLSGGGNTINEGTAATVTLTDTNNIFDTVNANAAAVVLAANTQVNLAGTSNTVTDASGDSLGVYGGGNNITTTNGTNDLLVIGNTNGAFDTLNVTGDVNTGTTANGQGTGIYLNNNAQANVNGSTNSITNGTGDSLGVYGGNNAIGTGVNDLVVVGDTNGAFDGIYATGDVGGGTTANNQGTGIFLDDNAEANVSGSGNSITNGTGDTLGVYGGNNSITSSANDLLVVGNTNGAFDGIFANGDVGGDFTANGDGTGIILDSDAEANVTGSGNSITNGTGGSLGVYGGNNTIGTGAGDLLVLGNTDDSFDNVIANGDVNTGTTADGLGTGIYLNNDTQANVTGSTNSITNGTGDSLGVYGGNNAIGTGVDDLLVVGDTGSAADGIFASGDVSGGTTADDQGTGIYLNADAQATLVGNGNYVGGSTNNVLNDTGNNNNIQFGSGGAVNISNDLSGTTTVGDSDGTVNTGSGNDVTVSDAGGTIDAGNSNDVTVTSGSTNIAAGNSNSFDLTGSDNYIGGGTSNAITDTGNDNNIQLGGGGSISVGTGLVATVGDTSGTISAGSSDNITVDGNSNYLGGGNNDLVTDDGNHNDLVLGSVGTFEVTSNVDATLTDSGGNILVGADNGILINGSNNYIGGGGHDYFGIDGTTDPVTDNSSTIDYGSSSDSGDDVTGSDDTGEGWADDGGGYGGDDDGGDDGEYGGYYGLAGKASTVSNTLGQNIGLIAAGDLSAGNIGAANAAMSGLNEDLSVATQETQNAVLTGAQWDSQVVTWSLATGPGTSAAPFSSYMGGEYESLVQSAFAAWGAATGLTFEEVSDSSSSDIRLGFGDFDTADTGVVGYTSYTQQNGQTNPDAIVLLEDPNEDPLTGDTDDLGGQTYTGTDASVYQTLLHEIGHALGFASNADPNSIMNYQLTGQNQTLDANDVEAGLTLYQGTAVSSSTNINQLVQSIAALAPSSSASSTPPISSNAQVQSMLLATAH